MSKPSLPFAMTKLNADRIVSWSAIFVSPSVAQERRKNAKRCFIALSFLYSIIDLKNGALVQTGGSSPASACR